MPVAEAAGPAIALPTVTQDDLNNFHAAHFGVQTPTPPGPTSWLSENHDEPPTAQLEAEEDLGYYADGTKRTLTDAQIAMFRHTEIHNLLRKRQLRIEQGLPENLEEDEEGEISPSAWQGDRKTTPVGAKRSYTVEYPHKRRKGRRSTHHKISVKSQHIAPDDPQGRTTRRLARDLDTEMKDPQPLELDY